MFHVYFERPPADVVFHLPAGRATVEARTNTGLTARANVALGETLAPGQTMTLLLE